MTVSEDRLARLLAEEAPPTVAVALLGVHLERSIGGGSRITARIVETEAYDESDPASHSHRGRTARNAAMFGPAGSAYVYRSYGVHWCLNVVVGPPDVGAAVLVRAAEVVEGIDAVRANRRGVARDRDLLRGPGRLAAGLDVDGYRHDGIDLLAGADGLRLRLPDDTSTAIVAVRGRVVSGPRVGVASAAEVPWRFHLAGAAVSDYRRSPRAPRAAR